MAHELNTPLAIIGLEVASLERLLGGAAISPPACDASVRDRVAEIRTQVDQAGRVARTMLQLARNDRVAEEPVSPADAVRTAVARARRRGALSAPGASSVAIAPDAPDEPRSLGAHLTICVVGDRAETACLSTDPVLLGQVLDNLLDNALRAVAEAAADRAEAARVCAFAGSAGSAGAKIAQRPGAVAPVAGCVEVLVRAPSGGGVEIEVSDDGPGVPEGLRERVFELFFTTRPHDGGSGIGLALCRDIAARLGGGLELRTAELGGACFVLRLPASCAAGRVHGPQRARGRAAASVHVTAPHAPARCEEAATG
jgi:signal transduction histidine kinase